MRYYIYLVMLILEICTNCSRTKYVKITPLPQLTEIDTIHINNKININCLEFYMVESDGHIDDNLMQNIRNYVTLNNNKKELKYFQYNMIFYKKSANVNFENINDYRKENKYKALLHDSSIQHYMWLEGTSTYVQNIKYKLK